MNFSKYFTDYSWYKDLKYNERDHISKQFQKKHNFMLAEGEERLMSEQENSKLCNILYNIKENTKEYEQTNEQDLIEKVIKSLNEILELKEYFNSNLCLFIEETIEILERFLHNEEIDYVSYQSFYYVVGKIQQYLSMVKKVNYEHI